MKPSRRYPFLLFGAIVLYAAAYGAYRQYGPASYFWPRNSKYPAVLCRTESRSDILTYNFFSPCIAVEDAFYRLKYRNVKHTLDDWNTMDSAGQGSQ
jgi:hypothetical protein